MFITFIHMDLLHPAMDHLENPAEDRWKIRKNMLRLIAGVMTCHRRQKRATILKTRIQGSRLSFVLLCWLVRSLTGLCSVKCDQFDRLIHTKESFYTAGRKYLHLSILVIRDFIACEYTRYVCFYHFLANFREQSCQFKRYVSFTYKRDNRGLANSNKEQSRSRDTFFLFVFSFDCTSSSTSETIFTSSSSFIIVIDIVWWNSKSADVQILDYKLIYRDE